MAITYADLLKVNDGLKSIDVKGKQYIPVVERIKAFRMLYPEGCIRTQLVSDDGDVCVIRAEVVTDQGQVLGTGTAFENRSGSYINKTSYIENCETSAVGRALGMAGFGIDESMCSADELLNALENQKKLEAPPAQKAPSKPVKVQTSASDVQTSAAVPPMVDLNARKALLMQWGADHKLNMVQIGDRIRALQAGGAVSANNWRLMTDEDFDAMMSALNKNFGDPA